MRERLSSRLGFILLSAGCAVGIGNVWRFPYVAGQSGGGCFLPIYIAALLLIGIPVLAMEFAVGRGSQRSITRAYGALKPENRTWRVHGYVSLIGLVLLMAFYVTVTGWMMIYFFKAVSGEFAGKDLAFVEGMFKSVLTDPWQQGAFTVGTCWLSLLVCIIGLRNGLESVTKWLMFLLMAFVVILAAKCCFLKGAVSGLRFFLCPDVARASHVGWFNVTATAICQAFFSLSIGIGAMTVFGSYIGKSKTLLGEAASVAALDTLVAVSSGLIVFSACSAYGVEVTQGPGLVFIVLPNIFCHMSHGWFWGGVFFLFLSIAAWTSVLAVFEGIISGINDIVGWSRKRICLMMAIAMPVICMPCVFGFNLLSSVQPLGRGSTILDFEDFLVSDLILPLGAVVFALFCSHRYGWGWENFIAEANAGEGVRFPRVARIYCGWIIPAIIIGICVISVIRRFS